MSDELVAALIGLAGVAVASLIQWVVARSVVRSETERLHRQLSIEFRQQQFSEWQSEFQAVIAELLASTDPEVAKPFQKEKVVSLVLRAQLMLNPNLPSHARVSGLVNQLALTVNGWHGEPDQRALLGIHSALLEAAKETLYLPGK